MGAVVQPCNSKARARHWVVHHWCSVRFFSFLVRRRSWWPNDRQEGVHRSGRNAKQQYRCSKKDSVMVTVSLVWWALWEPSNVTLSPSRSVVDDLKDANVRVAPFPIQRPRDVPNPTADSTLAAKVWLACLFVHHQHHLRKTQHNSPASMGGHTAITNTTT
ncbi:hypothetical protein PMIN06_009975 [Paraphaeosphaeria minitans]